jgi:''chromo'' (CHRromatin Organisation MOdifier) domain./Reverse transcriptase (RNA-dependent DNA polymerase)./Integrase core domain.
MEPYLKHKEESSNVANGGEDGTETAAVLNNDTSTNGSELKFLQQNLVNKESKENPTQCTEYVKLMVAKAKCSGEEQEELLQLCLEYKDRFVQTFTPEYNAGNSFFYPHNIKLSTESPLWTPQFRQSMAEKLIVEEATQKQFQMGVVEKTLDTTYNSPAMCVPKKDGTWRPVIDYRNINQITIKDNWHMPRAEEAYEALAKAKYMSVVDATCGYWQVPLTPESKKYTAFTTMSSRWQYTCLPMGITNAAPTFQKNMEAMLGGLVWKSVIVYIDDIIIYSNTFQEHKEHLREVLKRLRTANVVLKPEKCDLCQQEVEYLGHVVGNGVLKTCPRNVEKVKQCKLPQTLTQVRSFCNLAGYYRRFIHKYATIAKPLTDLMALKGKRVKIKLSDEAVKAFNTLKEAIVSEPVLALPDHTKPFGIRTDASGYAIGAVLFQKDETGHEKPIYFASRTLTPTEQKYSAGEREMLAIKYWIRYWHSYLWGRHFAVYTDHSPLMGIKTKKDVTRRLSSMIFNLQAYDYELHYTPGKENHIADTLSREPFAPKGITKEIPIKEIAQLLCAIQNEREDDSDWGEMPLNCNNIELQMLMNKIQGKKTEGKALEKGNFMAPILETEEVTEKITESQKEKAVKLITILNKQKKPFKIPAKELAKMQLEDETLDGPRTMALKEKEGQWVIHKECLHKVRNQRRKKTKSIQLVLPKPLREEVMVAYHDEVLAGHYGYFKTAQKIAQWYWWPNMHKDIKAWVKSCTVCQRFNKTKVSKEGKMAPIIATRPFQIMGMDIMVIPSPMSENGNSCIVLFTDYYTKWVEAFALPDSEATTVAQKLIQGILCRHGAPERIISDRGPNFTSDVFKEVTEMLGMKQSLTSGYHPQADGQAERNIGTLTRTISKMIESNHRNWDVVLPYALWAYRTAVHAVTKETPYFLVYGREPINPADLRIRQWMSENAKPEEYTISVAQRLIDAQERVIEEINKVKAYDKNRFDKGRKDSTYTKGDIVWLEQEKAPGDQTKKFMAKYIGPYSITKVITGGHDLNVEVTHVNNRNDIRIVNIRKLRRAILRPEQVEIIAKEIERWDLEALRNIPSATQPTNTVSKTPTNIPSANSNSKIKNPKGKTTRTQAIRAGLKKRVQDDREEWNIESIIDKTDCMNTGKTMYLIKWEGYPSSKNSWEYVEDIMAEEAIRKYESMQKVLNSIPEDQRKAKRKQIITRRAKRKLKRKT